MNLCFDIDGPIIDVADRYYRAYLESLKDIDPKKVQILTKETFWKLKQNRITDFEIGIISNLSIGESTSSAEIRRELTFKPEYLAQDKLFDDVFKTFEYLKAKKIYFFLVTLRRQSYLSQAIKQFRIDKYVSNERLFSIDDKQNFSNDIQEKYIMLVNAINKLDLDPRDTWMVGDSETDIHAGRLARYRKTIAISRGIRSREQLGILKPDYLVNDLSEVTELIK